MADDDPIEDDETDDEDGLIGRLRSRFSNEDADDEQPPAEDETDTADEATDDADDGGGSVLGGFRERVGLGGSEDETETPTGDEAPREDEEEAADSDEDAEETVEADEEAEDDEEEPAETVEPDPDAVEDEREPGPVDFEIVAVHGRASVPNPPHPPTGGERIPGPTPRHDGQAPPDEVEFEDVEVDPDELDATVDAVLDRYERDEPELGGGPS